MTAQDELLFEQVLGAHRARARDGSIKSHPAWHDLDADARAASFEASLALRQVESALDAQGLSGTAKVVLARIHASQVG